MAELTDEQCDHLVAITMDKLATQHDMHALDINADVTIHHSLRRSIVRAAYEVGKIKALPDSNNYDDHGVSAAEISRLQQRIAVMEVAERHAKETSDDLFAANQIIDHIYNFVGRDFAHLEPKEALEAHMAAVVKDAVAWQPIETLIGSEDNFDEIDRDETPEETIRNLRIIYGYKQDEIERLQKRIKEMEGRGEPDGWLHTASALPQSGKPVLVLCGKKVIRAAHAGKHELKEDDWGYFNDGDGGDYNEYDDCTYWPEGWYEWNEFEEIHWSIDCEPLYWMPLPAAPSPEDK